MRVVCSYCREDLGEKAPLDDLRVSHGMCPECHAYFRRQWRGLSLSEYLDGFRCPVVVVDENGRTIAVNRPMAERLGRAPEELIGLLGGEALECANSRLAGGCGKTVHCRTCTIRNSVTTTFETGEACVRVPAFLKREGSRVGLLVSTYKRGPVVQVVIESLPEAGDGLDGGTSGLREAPGLAPSVATPPSD